jgi:hypothetical protein
MKKIFTVVLVAVMVATGASAQLGIKVGYISSLDELKVEGLTLSPKGQNGFRIGANYDIALSDWGLSFRPGLNYTFIGGESVLTKVVSVMAEYDSFDINEIDHAVGIPLDLKYSYEFPSGVKLYAFAGARINVGLSSKIIINVEGGNVSIDAYSGKAKLTAGGQTIVEDTDEEIYKRLDFQLGMGTGVQYNAFSLEVGYDWGMLSRFAEDDFSEEGITLKRGQLFVGIGYSF